MIQATGDIDTQWILDSYKSRVKREEIRWAMRKLGVEEWLVSAVMSTYSGAKTVVRTVYGNGNDDEVKVSMHQGSALSPLLFVIVMEGLSRKFRVALPWELLHADDMVAIAETEDDLIKRLNEWKDNVENRVMKVNMQKTKVMISGEWQKVTQKAVRWPCGVCGRGLVIIQYSVLVGDRCRRSLELKERSSILTLWIWKKLLIEFREK